MNNEQACPGCSGHRTERGWIAVSRNEILVIANQPFLCPACESTAAGRRYTVPDHEYAVDFEATYTECTACNTLSQQPMPGMKTLATFYPESYHSFDGRNFIATIKHKKRYLQLKKHLLSERPVVLDYGCGDGSFLRVAARHHPGARFYGYEIAEARHIEILEDGRITIIEGNVDDLMAELPPCDLVTMHHVIEHLPDPMDTLRMLLRRLRPGGCLVGQTPAANCLEHRVFKTRWSGFHAPRHTVVFSRGGIVTLLQRAGFSRCHTRGAFNPAGVAVSLSSALHGRGSGRIIQKGLIWMSFVAGAALLYPIDLLSRKPAIMDFVAKN